MGNEFARRYEKDGILSIVANPGENFKYLKASSMFGDSGHVVYFQIAR